MVQQHGAVTAVMRNHIDRLPLAHGLNGQASGALSQ